MYRTLKQTCTSMIALCPCQVWWVVSTHPWELFVSRAPHHKITWRKRAKSSITEPWIVLFRSNFVQSLNTGQPKCCKSSRSKVKVTARHNVSASNNAIIQARISCRNSNLVKISQSQAQHVTHFVGYWVKYLNHNNSVVDSSIVFKFGMEFHHVTGDTLHMLKVKGTVESNVSAAKLL